MLEVVQSETFSGWLSNLADRRARAKVQTRIDRLATGNPGDTRSIRSGVIEMRIDYGSGYRVYYMRRGSFVVVLLCGGDKSTQRADIKRAIAIANDWSD